MSTRSNYQLVESSPGRIVIRDIGDHRHRTLTNDADNVVAELLRSKRIKPTSRIYYYDSEGEPGEMVHDGVRFVGFEPWGGLR